MQFDRVFGMDAEQEAISQGAQVDIMVHNCIEGFHSTILCYGQTGSGKTYTMDGFKYKKSEKGVFLPVIDKNDDAVNDGLVQRSVRKLM